MGHPPKSRGRTPERLSLNFREGRSKRLRGGNSREGVRSSVKVRAQRGKRRKVCHSAYGVSRHGVAAAHLVNGKSPTFAESPKIGHLRNFTTGDEFGRPNG